MKYNFSYFKKLFENSSIMDFKYIYIYGDLRFFLAQNVNDKKFIHKLLNYFISKKITIIVPSFSYTKDKFYLNKTKSKVGFLSNYILKNFNFKRSEHPLFSYVSIGPNKNIVKNIGKSAFGLNSIYTRLLFNNACFLHIGRDLKFGNTLVHHIEQNFNANYRFDKNFNTKVYDNKKYIGKNFKAYVRKKIDDKYSFTFRKILKKKSFVDMINYLNRERKYKTIFFYSYDDFYIFLHEQYLKNINIFVKLK